MTKSGAHPETFEGDLKSARRKGRAAIAEFVYALAGAASRNALVFLLVALVILFWRLLPGTFLSGDNIRSVLATQSIGALLALAVLVPLTCNQFDLSVGYGVGLANVLAIGLQAKNHLSWPLTVVLVLASGLALGTVNGLVVTRGRVNSFIATLGSGTVVYAIGLWYTGGESLIGNLPQGFTNISSVKMGIPLPALYVLVVAVVLGVVLEYMPPGRHLYVIGASARAAELVGIRSARLIMAAFIASGLITAIAGVSLASLLQSGQSTTGPEYLLPAFAAAFLGSTSVHPGRVNVGGTLLAVLTLACVVTGLEEEGFSAWVQPLFDGVMVVGAVGISGYVLRKRANRLRMSHVQDRLAAAASAREEPGLPRHGGRPARDPSAVTGAARELDEDPLQ